MYSFDPAINYGPNDAGVSAFSIALVVIGIMAGSLLISTVFGFIANAVKGKNDE